MQTQAPNEHDSSNNQPQRPHAFGKLIAYFRREHGMTLRQVATAANMKSHTHIGAIERGEVTPNLDTAEQIARGLQRLLNLSDGDYSRLMHSARSPSPLVAPGFMVDPKQLIESQCLVDVREVWVVAESMLEIDPSLLSDVIRNIATGKDYVYFLPDRIAWEHELCPRLMRQANEETPHERVTAIGVPEAIHPFLFQPAFALYLAQGRQAIGAWAFREPNGGTLDRACEMDSQTAASLHHALHPIVRSARHGQDYKHSGFGGAIFNVLHAPLGGSQ